MIGEIFLSLFVITFVVALIAFAAYGYLLITLLKNHSKKFRPENLIEFIGFLWQLILYYIHKALPGFFEIERSREMKIVKEYEGEIKNAASEHEKLVKIYRLFSSAYILFFILLICLLVVLLYMVFGPYL